MVNLAPTAEYSWQYCNILKYLIHSSHLVHPDFHPLTMTRHEYHLRLMSQSLDYDKEFAEDIIPIEKVKNHNALLALYNEMEAKYHDNNHVTVGLNIRLFDKGINRNTNQIVIMQIFKSLSAISASKQISVYIYGCSKIPKFLIEEANKYSVKVYLISGYNSNNSWGFMNSIEDSHETSEYQITIEQIILRFSTLVMCPPSDQCAFHSILVKKQLCTMQLPRFLIINMLFGCQKELVKMN